MCNMCKSCKKSKGILAFAVMIVGFIIGLFIGRGLEWDNDEDDE